MCVRILVCKVFRPDDPGRFTHPSKKLGDVAPFLFRGDWGPIGAVRTPEIDDFRSDFWGVDRAQKPYLQCSHTRGFKQPHGIALELVYRAENRCKSSGAPAEGFPKPPGAGLGREAAQNRRFPVLPPSRKKPKNHFDCIGFFIISFNNNIFLYLNKLP